MDRDRPCNSYNFPRQLANFVACAHLADTNHVHSHPFSLFGQRRLHLSGMLSWSLRVRRFALCLTEGKDSHEWIDVSSGMARTVRAWLALSRRRGESVGRLPGESERGVPVSRGRSFDAHVD